MTHILRAVVCLLAVPSFALAEGFYTADQAKRGEIAFNKYCAVCHTFDTVTPMAEQTKGTGRGFRMGTRTPRLYNLGSGWLFTTFEERPNYPSAWFVFNRIRRAMPPYGADLIGNDVKVDLTAYILQANGLPPGPSELPYDIEALKDVRIPNQAITPPDETGFVSLFNGKDFTGWKFMLGPNCRSAPEGCGKTTPSGVFKIADGKLVCTGKTQGYMYTEKTYLNFTLRFEYRFEPPPDWPYEEDVVFDAKGGYFLFLNDHRVWPKSIQIEGNYRNVGVPSAMGSDLEFTTEPGAVQMSRRLPGAWNSVEIVSRDGKVMSYQNGILITTITAHEFKEPGSIGFESEGSEMQWRNIRIK